MKKNIFTTIFLSIFFLTSCETIDSIRPSRDIVKTSPDSLRLTNSGPVIGTEGEEGIHIWFGVPYAEAPLGKLRWKAPRNVNSWDKVYEATNFGSPCVQIQSSLTGGGLAKPGDIIGNEDCLYLNIYAPSYNVNSVPKEINRLPVMVWIHGGGNTSGMTSEYNPERFVVSQNIIVVTISYRLGLFGWFSHPELRKKSDDIDASANFGLLDQIKALEWLRDNIEVFGGDKNNITIFGESAGGQNVIALYVSSLAKGLFHRAISQSGGITLTSIEDAEEIDRNIHPLGKDYRYRHKTTKELVNSLLNEGIINTHFHETGNIEELMNLESHDLMRNWSKGKAWEGTTQLARIIGDDLVLPKDSILAALRDKDRHANVPIILGVNKDENKTFNLFDEELVTNILNFTFIVKDPFFYDLKSDYQSLAWRSNAVDTPADAIVNGGYSNVYAYRFDWDEQPSILGMDFSFLLGAGHGLEIPFVMGDFDFGRQTRFLFTKKNESERIKLSKLIMQYWAHFAKDGYPNAQLENAVQWDKWPKGGINKDRIMILDTEQSNAPRMSNGYAPHDKLVNIFENDERSLKVNNKCSFLKDVYSWVDNWQIKNDACR